MISGFYRHSAVVAIVHKLVSALGVDFKQHGHGRVLGSSQGRELPVSFPRHGEECVTAVHHITRDEVIRIGRPRQGGGDGRGGIEEDCEEDILVFLHGLVDLGGEVVTRIDRITLLAGLATRTRLFAPLVSLVSLLWSPPLMKRKRNKEMSDKFKLLGTHIHNNINAKLLLNKQ